MTLSAGETEEHERSFPSKTSKSNEPHRWEAVEDGASSNWNGSSQVHPLEIAGAVIVYTPVSLRMFRRCDGCYYEIPFTTLADGDKN